MRAAPHIEIPERDLSIYEPLVEVTSFDVLSKHVGMAPIKTGLRSVVEVVAIDATS
jgi:hypothetical protein